MESRGTLPNLSNGVRAAAGCGVLLLSDNGKEGGDTESGMITTRKKIAFGVSMLVGATAFLANFGAARTTLAMLWPSVTAVLPVLALAVAAGGAVLIYEPVRRSFALRRPSERFRRLAPAIERMASRSQEPASTRSEWIRHIKQLDETRNELEALTPLGVGMPKDQDDYIDLLLLAQKAQLAEARKRFPLPDESDGSVPGNPDELGSSE